MSNFIQKLQNQPRAVRVMVLWIATAVCMVGIFVFWLSTLDFGSSPSLASSQNSSADISQTQNDIPSLWQSLKAGVGELFTSAPQAQTNQQGGSSNSSATTSQPKIEIVPSGQPSDTQQAVPGATLP